MPSYYFSLLLVSVTLFPFSVFLSKYIHAYKLIALISIDLVYTLLSVVDLFYLCL